jgi:hypothetical protein
MGSLAIPRDFHNGKFDQGCVGPANNGCILSIPFSPVRVVSPHCKVDDLAAFIQNKVVPLITRVIRKSFVILSFLYFIFCKVTLALTFSTYESFAFCSQL